MRVDPLEYELNDGLGVLQFHGAPDGHPSFGFGNLKKIVESKPKVNELALDVRQEPAIVHILGIKKVDRWGLGTMHTLDQDPIEV
jgi:hypothetical protein